MAFHDVRLPEQIERGSQGGPRFRTSVLTLSSGYEKRNIDWELSRSMFNVGYGIQTKADFSTVIDFFYARQGRAHSFRFKDWADFEITDQLMATSDGTTTQYQMFKRYTSGGINFDRDITKPVSGSFTATFDGVSRTVEYDTGPTDPTGVRINTLTGVIVLNTTDAATTGLALNLTGEFDIPVRFDTDMLDVNLQTFDAGAIPELSIAEVRGE
jgi:uncharacterized protein (TIGR02217 family)